ncbi:tachykinin-3b [Hypomesus transpacificus]|uniref:tachykinin-3b n=1 Tax=Hypomesus transpacificus TaxID=137520 RepID=UPI001F07D5D2|nr:tachykinin-3b [Hypomesus transpacificus]XP_046880773.1 tachykinin-3b [Hypomesus transpacificus]
MFGNCWALALVSFLMVLASGPTVSWCQELSQNSPTFLNRELTNLKRFSDIDYDSFVGLMGRRYAGDMHDVFVGLFGRRSPETVPRPLQNVGYPQPAGGFFIHKGRLRLQRNA